MLVGSILQKNVFQFARAKICAGARIALRRS
jgi:hypothetical protein